MFRWLFNKQKPATQPTDSQNDNTEPAENSQSEATVQTEASLSQMAPASEPEPPVVDLEAQEETAQSATAAAATADEPPAPEAPIAPEMDEPAAELDTTAAPQPIADSSVPSPVSPQISEASAVSPASVPPTTDELAPPHSATAPQLEIGATVIAANPPRYDEAKVLDVQASGHRVVVGYDNATRAYSLREDGSYRLEHAPDNSPSELIFDKTIDELKSFEDYSRLPAAASMSEGAPAFVTAPMAETAQAEPSAGSTEPAVTAPPGPPVITGPVRKRPGKSTLEPVAGSIAVVAAPPRYDEVKIVTVQAGGRRIIVGIGNSTRVYSRRQDGSYRLEGAPDSSSARLIFGKSIDEIKLMDRKSGAVR